MKWLGVGSASSRRTMVAILFAGLSVSAVSVQAQTPAPAQDPAAPAPAPAEQAPAAPAPPDPFKFTTDAAVIIWSIKPEMTSQFESTWGAIKAKLATSDKPDLKALGDNLKMYKADGPPGPQGTTYIFVADPASKTVSYSPSPFLLFEAGLFEDAEARALFDQLSPAINGINPLPINVLNPPAPPPMAPAAPAADPAAPGAPAAPAAPATPPAQ